MSKTDSTLAAVPSASAAAPASFQCSQADIQKVAENFARWLDKVGYASFDPYDMWGTSYGKWARQTYYEKGFIGVPFIAPILLMEILWPGARRFFVEKQRFATADAQLLLGLLNLYNVTKDKTYLSRAAKLGDELLTYSIPGFKGYCWGYPFDWQTNKGLWKKNTPFITSTPYCFEAYLGLHDATGEPRYLEIARSIAVFVHDDLKDTELGPNSAASSYSPIDTTKVLNASAYRAYVLVEAAERLNRPDYMVKARKNIEFILENQREDGAWLYAIGNPAEAFIDHFHTCFVLKNLYKLNVRLKDERIRKAIHLGWDYYFKNFFDADENPKMYTIQPRAQIMKVEMYNVAEAVTLGAVLRDEIPEAYALADRFAKKLRDDYQVSAGHFVSRIYLGGIRHTFPFLRWPQAQLFYSVTNLLYARATAPRK